MLAEARAEIPRFTPAEAQAAVGCGAILVDIRPSEQRLRDGLVPGAFLIDRNVLEWRLDPSSPHRDPRIADAGRPVILICDEGYQTSLAAATLRRFGLEVGDLIDGVQGWKSEGLPLLPAVPADSQAP